MGLMDTNDNDIRIDIEANTAGLKAGVAEANASLDSLSQTFRQPAAAMEAMNKQGDAFVASLRRQVDTFGMTRGQVVSYDAQIRGLTGAHLDSANALGKQLDALDANEKMLGRVKIAAAAAGAVIATAFIGVLKGMYREVTEAEQSGARLEAVLRATGGAARLSLAQIKDMSAELARSTLFDDEQIQDAAAMMLTFKSIQGDTFRQAMQMSADLSATFGTDLKSSVLQLGKALEDPERGLSALRRSGVSFTDAQKDMIKGLVEAGRQGDALTLILTTMREQGLDKTAQAMKTGVTKEADDLAKAWRDLLQTMGKTEAFTGGVTTLFSSLTSYLRETKNVIESGDWFDKLIFYTFGHSPFAMAKALIVGKPPSQNGASGSWGDPAAPAASPAFTPPDKDAEAKAKAAAKAAADAAQNIRDVIDSLKFEAAQLGRSAEAQELYNRLKQAGVSIGSQAGQQIKALTEDLTRQQAVLSALDREFDEAVKGQEAMVKAFDAARMAENVAAQKALADEVDRLIARLNAKADAESDAQVAANALIKGYTDETAVLGLSNEQREMAIAMRQMEAVGINLTAKALEDYTQRLTAAVQANQFAKAAKDLDAYLNPAKAKSFGDALSNAFGKAGTAMGKMAGAFDNYAQAQAEFNEKMKALSPEDRIEREIELSKKQGEIQVNAYGDMAGAAKAFFDEGSTGYKVLSAAEQGFRAVQMALSIASMIQGAAETTTSVAQSGTKAAASTTAGVAKAFEQMGVWGFVGAAAIIAFMASMGVRGGSGSVSMSAMRQSEQGTGTVLGDPDAKSESLINALDMLADVNTLTMQYSARMAKSLQNIEIALTGVSSMIYRTPGLTSGNLSGIQEMSKTGTLGFSSKSVAVTDSGLTYQGLISGIAEGLQSFTEVTTKKSSWFGLKKSTRTDTVLTDADDDVSQQFQMIFNNISDSLIAAGGVLGNSADILETQIANIEIDLGMVSLKGLKGDELEEALNAVISASADNIARQALPGLDKYQQVGEGYFETAIRVAYSTEVVQASLAALDKGFTGAATDIVDFSQSLINAFGDLETMGDALAGYYDLFYSEEEKLAHTTASLVAGFARINLEVPETSAGFRALVDALDLTTAAGQDAFVAMMDMAPAFAEVAEAAIDTAEALNDAALDAADAAMSALSRAVGAERDTIIAAYEQQSAAIQASINSVSSSVANLTALSSALASTLIGMRPQEYAAQYRAQAQAQIGAALAIARAGGQLPTAESLKGALSTLTQDSRGQFATRTDYMRDQLRTAAELRELSDLADDALSIDERQLRAMQDQLDQLKLGYEGEMLRLDSILDSAQAQIDALHGIDTSVLSVEAAIVALGAAINAAKAPAAVAAASGTASAGGSATHALTSTIAAYGAANGGDAYYFIEGINDLSAKMETKAMIAATLGITVEEAWAKFDSKGLAYWEEVQRQWDAGLKPTTSSIPGFAVGTNYVPSDMVAQIHAGERIIPAADNTELMARLRDPQANNAALVAELKALREEVVLLRAETRATVSNTGKTAALLDRAMPDGDAMATRAAA